MLGRAVEPSSSATKDLIPVELILVEDDDGDARAICRALAKARIANPVIRYSDGVEALEALRANDAALPSNFIILLDINMPRMTGHEFLAELRKDPNLSDAIVFVLTTSADEFDISQAYAKNVAGYVLKSRVGENFIDLLSTLDSYWKLVEKPDMSRRRTS